MNAERAVAPIRRSRTVRTYVDGLKVVTFDPAFRDEFKRLNIAWLERYFRVEPIDEVVLGDPENVILAPGGEILFALLDGQVVGTVGLKLEAPDRFELTKMAVDERWQGRGFGQYLLETALAVAREQGHERIVLYSQTELVPAIALYRKNGFIEVNEPLCGKYARCNIKMEKRLDR